MKEKEAEKLKLKITEGDSQEDPPELGLSPQGGELAITSQPEGEIQVGPEEPQPEAAAKEQWKPALSNYREVESRIKFPAPVREFCLGFFIPMLIMGIVESGLKIFIPGVHYIGYYTTAVAMGVFFLLYSIRAVNWAESATSAVSLLTGRESSQWDLKRRVGLLYPPFFYNAVIIIPIMLVSDLVFGNSHIPNWVNTFSFLLWNGLIICHLIVYTRQQLRVASQLSKGLAEIAELNRSPLPWLLRPSAIFFNLTLLPIIAYLMTFHSLWVMLIFSLWQPVFYKAITTHLRDALRALGAQAISKVKLEQDKILIYRAFAALERWWKQRTASRSTWKTITFVLLIVACYLYFSTHPNAAMEAFTSFIGLFTAGTVKLGSETPQASNFDAHLSTLFMRAVQWLIVIVSGTFLYKFAKAPRGLAVGPSGIRFTYGNMNKRIDSYLPWTDIERVEIFRPEGKTTVFDDLLLLHRLSVKRPFKIALGSLPTTEDKEALLQAFDTYAPTVPRPANVIEALSANIEHSYTELWMQALAAPPKRERLKPLIAGAWLNDNRYLILKELGVGGQGFAYLAEDKNSGDQIVLKEFVLPVFVDINARKQALDRFEKEARLLTQLDHPQVVKLTGFFVEDHRAYLALEHIDGRNLRQIVGERGPMPEQEVSALAEQMKAILIYLHGLSPPLVHRDFTPDNLILHKDGTLKLIDFNVAQQVESATTGTVVGKQAYLPPEQFRGQATTKSDMYAMGATLYFLLTGKDPVPISQSSPKEAGVSVSNEMDSLIMALTSIDENDRPNSADLPNLIT